jgi:hypothetical protein
MLIWLDQSLGAAKLLDLCRFEMSQSLTDPSIRPKSNKSQGRMADSNFNLGMLKKNVVVVVHDQPQGVGQGHFPQLRHAEAQHGREVGGWWSRVSVISRQTNAKKGLVHLSFG